MNPSTVAGRLSWLKANGLVAADGVPLHYSVTAAGARRGGGAAIALLEPPPGQLPFTALG